MTLGDFGQILESPAGVLKVEFFENDTKERVDIVNHAGAFGMEEPLFTGTVLVEYDGKGNWSPPSLKKSHKVETLRAQMHSAAPTCARNIGLEPIGTNASLFVMRPSGCENQGKA